MKKVDIEINSQPQQTQEPTNKEVGQISLDIFTHEKEIIILAPIAGASPDDITLAITEDVLTIKGVRPQKYQVNEEDYYTKECFWGRFSRSIVLPLEADTASISAQFEKNILEIRIPRKEINRTNIIKINASDED